jgi:hypothetical protein
MVKKTYIITKETKIKRSMSLKKAYQEGRKIIPINIGKWNIGRKHTEEWKRKNSESHKGIIPWNKGLRGIYKTSDETKEKLRILGIGRKQSKESIEKTKLAQKGISRWNKEEKEMLRQKTKQAWKDGKFGKERNKKIGEALKLQHKLGTRKCYFAGYWIGKKRDKQTFEKILNTKRINGTIFSGDKHYNWQGGKSFEPYGLDFNNQFKLAIKQRDGFMCLKCGMREEDSIKLFNRKLHIHHINYDKKLTIVENCCALCCRCNCEANFNRNSWTKFFQSLLTEIYKYKYEDNGNIILGVKKCIQ